jgi:hypothetical protein
MTYALWYTRCRTGNGGTEKVVVLVSILSLGCLYSELLYLDLSCVVIELHDELRTPAGVCLFPAPTYQVFQR